MSYSSGLKLFLSHLRHPFLALKKITPKSLFSRTLIILFFPLIMAQLVLGYIFFDRHTETILRVLSNTIGGDIALVHDLVEKGASIERIQILSRRHLSLQVSLEPGQNLDRQGVYKKTWLYSFLDEALEKQLSTPYYVRMTEDDIFISLESSKGLIQVKTPRKRLFSRTTPLVLIWTISSSIILFLVASLFMRNQIRPIKRLARAAELFGKGQDDPEFKPEGALEVRKAGQSFINMRDSLKKQLSERLEMLAGVSHDLRTPITRLKLQLALMKDSPEKEHLAEDVETMRQMVEGFLDYARGLQGEDLKSVELNDFVGTLIRNLKINNIKISFNSTFNFNVNIKMSLVNRCLTNILLNCDRYATKCEVTLKAEKHGAIIHIDDNGPGIPENEREWVFKPFYRADASRNLDSTGVGLGLTVAKDGIMAHGGDIKLEDSPLGGLRVTVRLPR